MNTADSDTILSVRGLSKSFGGAQALNGVSLDIEKGHVHGLIGHNGSGKSTLIKILAGFHQPDGGEVLVAGKLLGRQEGRQQGRGIRFVHQDLGLVPELTVLDNLLLGDMAGRRWERVRWKSERARAQALLDELDVAIEPERPVSSLTPVDKAQVAIVRAFGGAFGAERPALVVLDEPTVYLTQETVAELFGLVRRIVDGGSSVLFVSHHLREVVALTDQVTVLRGGSVVATVETRDQTEEGLVELMVGGVVQHGALATSASGRQHNDIQIAGLTGTRCNDVRLGAASGSVLGLAGLPGSGAEELPYILSGVEPATSGILKIRGETIDVANLTPHRAISSSIGLVPADRLHQGLLISLSVKENILGQRLHDFAKKGVVLSLSRMASVAKAVLAEYSVYPAQPDLTLSSLSGGNQQKVMLARWLQLRPRLLLMHEPTQGVDVGAREEIYRLVRSAANGGAAVLVTSADFEQLANLCDRVAVFVGGVVTEVLPRDQVSEEVLVERTSFTSSPEYQRANTALGAQEVTE
jgi:ribose transport system ATP-binding protein